MAPQEPESLNLEAGWPDLDEVDRLERLRDRVAGVLLGGAVADALGWPTEFTKTRSQAERLFDSLPVSGFRAWEKRTGGRFNTYIDYISPGEYSDDTQLTLCTARSILADGSFDPAYFAEELGHWLYYARGAGATITRAARSVVRRRASWDDNFFSGYTEAGANGGAMRIAPHALANTASESTALSGVWRNVAVTHGHPRALWGGLLYARALLVLLAQNGLSLDSFLKSLHDLVDNWRLLDSARGWSPGSNDGEPGRGGLSPKPSRRRVKRSARVFRC